MIKPQEIEAVSKRCAFLSTPSLYFSLRDATLKDASVVFDVRPVLTLPSFSSFALHQSIHLASQLSEPFTLLLAAGRAVGREPELRPLRLQEAGRRPGGPARLL